MKKTGKALSLVLSLALVVSSLTATFASAASKSETANAWLGTDTFYLCNGGSNKQTKIDLVDYLKTDGLAKPGMSTTDGYSITGNMGLKELVITSGANYATLGKAEKDSSTGYINSQLLTLTSTTKTGTVTVAARYQGTIERGEDGATDVTAYATTTLTLKILQNGAVYFGASKPADGAYPDAIASLSKSPIGETNSSTGVVLTVSPSDTSALATWHTPDMSGTGKDNFLVTPSSSSKSVIASTTAGMITVNTTTPAGTNIEVAGGSVTLTAQKLGSDNKPLGGTATTKATTTVKVVNKVTARDASYTLISSYGGKTYLWNQQVTSTTHKDAQDVTGADVVLLADTEMYSGTIGHVSGAHQFTIDKGTVSSVGGDSSNNVTAFVMNGGTVSGAIGSSNHPIASVEISAGSTSAIYGATVNVTSSETAKPISTGDISKVNTLTVSSIDSSKVSVGKITVTGDTPLVTLTGNDVTVGQIDSNYENTSLNLTGFIGTIAAPINAYTVGVGADHHGISVTVANNTDLNSNVTVTGNAVIPTLDASEGTINFTGSLTAGKIGGISGSGVVGVEPSKLYSQGSISGISMKLLSDFKVGDVAFTADTGLVDSDSFTPFGYTLKTTEGTTKDTFTVASTNFAGLQISGSNTITVGSTATYTASPYPTGTVLPAGDSIAWSFNGDEDEFTFASNGNTATLKANKLETTFSSLNNATLTAKVVDANGDEVVDYPEATYNVSIVATPTFTTDSFPTTMKAGQQYQVKITSTDGTKPSIAFANNFAVITKTTTSGKATFVTFTAKTAGEHGVYVSGNKVAVIKVAGSICDTTTVTKKAGQPYTFKVTSPKAPTFVVAGIGSIKPSKVIGHDYYYMVKATTNKGVHGVYVNGAAIALYTFA